MSTVDDEPRTTATVSTHAEQFRAGLTAAFEQAALDQGVTGLTTSWVRPLVDAVTEDWNVVKRAPKSHDHPLYEGPDELLFAITTKPRPLTEQEEAAKQALLSRTQWIFSDHKSPPPADIGGYYLLRQRRWWVSKDGTVHLLTEMAASHRANLLAMLERGALRYQMSELSSGVFDEAPDDVVDQAAEEHPMAWLARQPLVKRLRKMAKADAILSDPED